MTVNNFDWISVINSITPLVSVVATALIAYFGILKQSKEGKASVIKERHEVLLTKISSMIGMFAKLSELKHQEESCRDQNNFESADKFAAQVADCHELLVPLTHEIRMRVYNDSNFAEFNTLVGKALKTDILDSEISDLITMSRQIVNRDFERVNAILGLHYPKKEKI